MRTLLAFVFAASIVGNVALGIYVMRSVEPAGEGVRQVGAAGTAAGANFAAAANDGVASGADRGPAVALSTRDPKSLVQTLRAAGFSPAMLRSIANQLAREHVAQDPSEIAPYWKRESFDPANRQARLALEKQRLEFVEELLGDDARPSVELNAGQRQRQFGNIPAEKIDAIARIERDYAEVRQTAQAAKAGQVIRGEQVQEMMREQELLEQEKRADLAALLTADELEQYDMRNSRTASNVMNHARLIDLSESEYNALYRAQKEFDDANPRLIRPDADALFRRNESQDALNERARAILGDERFYRYLESADSGYGNVARFAEQQQLAPSTAYEVYRIQREMQNAMGQFARDRGNVPMAQRVTEAQTLAAEYESRLRGLLSPEAMEAYKQQGAGRMLNSMNRTAPPNALPAVGLPGGG